MRNSKSRRREKRREKKLAEDALLKKILEEPDDDDDNGFKFTYRTVPVNDYGLTTEEAFLLFYIIKNAQRVKHCFHSYLFCLF